MIIIRNDNNVQMIDKEIDVGLLNAKSVGSSLARFVRMMKSLISVSVNITTEIPSSTDLEPIFPVGNNLLKTLLTVINLVWDL